MTKETKQTAVEWIYVELYKFLSGKSEFQEANDILKQAKEMEKEQTIDFAFNALKIADDTMNGYVDVDKLYNETYGGKK